MVAPHETGDLVRSLVRVPGSGSISTLESKCLNLSNVSSAAAAVFVPSTLPPALAQPQSQNRLPGATATESNASGESDHSASSTKKTADNKKRSLQQEADVTENNHPSLPGREMNMIPPVKRPRVVYMTPEQALSYCRRTSSIAVASGSLILSSSQTAQQRPNFPSSATTSVSQLLQERDALRDENRVLQHQLLLFRQLMTNKERLASVVRRLGVHVPES